MKLIHYAGETFLTGDAIADALLDYATALARRTRADRVEFPVISVTDGSLARIEIVLGPASQLVVETRDSEDTNTDGLQDATLEAEIRRRTAALHNPRPLAAELPAHGAEPDANPHRDLSS